MIRSLRLRTLPLSVSGILVGSIIACRSGIFRVDLFPWLVLTTLSLQILSNLCNEWGDWEKGTDRDQKGRKALSLQQGKASPRQLKGLMILFALLAIACGAMLIFKSFGSFFSLGTLAFGLLGITSIAAAVCYTMGKHPYGYFALGDLFVFFFFGLVSVLGSYFLYAHRWEPTLLLPATAIGLLVTGVLNVNNIRDIENDTRHGKHTFAALLCSRKEDSHTAPAKAYHTSLIVIAIICSSLYGLIELRNGLLAWKSFAFLAALPLLIWHLVYVWKYKGAELDRSFKILVLGVLVFALCGA